MPSSSDPVPTPSRQNASISARRGLGREKIITSQEKWPIVDDYRYLNMGLARQPMAHDVQKAAVSILAEKHRLERRANRVKANMDESDATYLANEMDRMLSTANPMCQTKLFKVIKNSITNLADKTSGEATEIKNSQTQSSKVSKKPQRVADLNTGQKKGITAVPNVVPVASILSSVKQKQKMRKLSSAGAVGRLARETSVTTTTTTTTRCKLKDPTISIIESSKTNVLHRCYGKQNVKVVPQMNKSNNRKSVITCQRPNVQKTSQKTTHNRSQKENQLPGNNKQMKTIFENEQYTKSKEEIPSTIESGSTSYSSLEQKESLRGIIKNTNYSPNSKDNETTTSHKDKKKQLNKNENNEHKVVVIETEKPPDNDPDNSIVQRLTSFWNKKLNTDGNVINVTESGATTSDESTMFSSLTSLTNRKSSYDLNDERLMISASKQSTQTMREATIIQSKGGGDGEIAKNLDIHETRLSDMKLGLLDELMKVLKRKVKPTKLTDDENTASCIGLNYTKDTDDSMNKIVDKNTNNKMIDDEDTSSSSEEYDNCENDSDDVTNESDDETTYSSDNNDDDHQNKEDTIQAIATCLAKKMHNLKKSKCTDHYDMEVIDVDERNSRTTSTTSTTSIVSSIEVKRTDVIEINTKEMSQHEDDIEEEDVDDSLENANENMELIIDINEDVNDNVIKDEREMNKKRIITSITNVNDIILNLRSMINEIESIPEDMKVMAMDLNVLPISNQLRKTLSIIVDNKPDKEEIIANDTDTNNQSENYESPLLTTEIESTSLTTSKQNISLDDKCEEIIESKNVINSYKTECISTPFYLPSTYNLPTVEGVMSIKQVILFPKREDYLRSRCKTFIVERNNKLDPIEDKYEDITNDELIKCESKNNDKSVSTYVKRFQTKSPYQSTLFYMTSKPKGLMTTRCPSIMFHPFQKNDNALLNTDKLNNSETTVEEEVITCSNENNSKIDLIRTSSKNSRTFVSTRQCNIIVTSITGENTIVDLNNNNNSNISNVLFENDNENASIQKTSNINSVDANTSSQNETNVGTMNQVALNNNNIRKLRCLFQTGNTDEDDVLTGGSGDYGNMATPCIRTSSMSVVASGSVNDSISQTDMNDSEHRSGAVISQSDVIYETDEHPSDIEDCLMRNNDQIQDTDRSQIDSSTSQEAAACNSNATIIISDNFGRISLSTQQRGTSTTGLTSYTPKITPTRDIGTITSCPSTTKEDKGVNYDHDLDKDMRSPKDYVVLCCNTDTPERVFRQKTVVHTNSSFHKLIKSDSNLHQELGDLVDIDNLCEKERKLITVCLVLLKRNATVENTLMAILLHSMNKLLTSLWNTTKQKVVGKIRKLLKNRRLLMHQESDTDDYNLCCQYKQLMKIIYTTLVSLTLCFIIQKNFCGFNLPVRFPW